MARFPESAMMRRRQFLEVLPVFRRTSPAGFWLSIPSDDALSAEPEPAALMLPAHGKEADPLEMARGQLDGLTPLQDCFDEVGCQKGEGKRPADLARIAII